MWSIDTIELISLLLPSLACMVLTVETPLCVTSDCEVYAMIRVFTAKGANAIQIHHKLVFLYSC